MILLPIAVLATLISVYALFRPSSEQQEAALLPFADDPQAAQRLEEETGLHCEVIVDGTPPLAPTGRFQA